MNLSMETKGPRRSRMAAAAALVAALAATGAAAGTAARTNSLLWVEPGTEQPKPGSQRGCFAVLLAAQWVLMLKRCLGPNNTDTLAILAPGITGQQIRITTDVYLNPEPSVSYGYQEVALARFQRPFFLVGGLEPASLLAGELHAVYPPSKYSRTGSCSILWWTTQNTAEENSLTSSYQLRNISAKVWTEERLCRDTLLVVHGWELCVEVAAEEAVPPGAALLCEGAFVGLQRNASHLQVAPWFHGVDFNRMHVFVNAFKLLPWLAEMVPDLKVIMPRYGALPSAAVTVWKAPMEMRLAALWFLAAMAVFLSYTRLCRGIWTRHESKDARRFGE